MTCARCGRDDFTRLGREAAWPRADSSLRAGWLCWDCWETWLKTDFGGQENQPVNVYGEWTTLARERAKSAREAA